MTLKFNLDELVRERDGNVTPQKPDAKNQVASFLPAIVLFGVVSLVVLFGDGKRDPSPVPAPVPVGPVEVDWTALKNIVTKELEAIRDQTPKGFSFETERKYVANAFSSQAIKCSGRDEKWSKANVEEIRNDIQQTIGDRRFLDWHPALVAWMDEIRKARESSKIDDSCGSHASALKVIAEVCNG